MCGREASFYSWREVVEFCLPGRTNQQEISTPLRLTTPSLDPTPNYNRAPSQKAWVLRAEQDEVGLAEISWGLVSTWTATKKLAPIVNARVETAPEKPSFRAAWRQRRCLIPSSGYYEWQQFARKQPYFIRPANAAIFMYAGLWERNDLTGLSSYCILTQPSQAPIAHIHDRMPVMLPAPLLRRWLFCPSTDAVQLLNTVTPPELAFYPVSPAVGNVRNQSSDLIAEVVPMMSDDLFGR
jgi:putative SOS response-associated peptidase YedK